jgi:hypothetical protein
VGTEERWVRRVPGRESAGTVLSRHSLFPLFLLLGVLFFHGFWLFFCWKKINCAMCQESRVTAGHRCLLWQCLLQSHSYLLDQLHWFLRSIFLLSAGSHTRSLSETLIGLEYRGWQEEELPSIFSTFHYGKTTQPWVRTRLKLAWTLPQAIWILPASSLLSVTLTRTFSQESCGFLELTEGDLQNCWGGKFQWGLVWDPGDRAARKLWSYSNGHPGSKTFQACDTQGS